MSISRNRYRDFSNEEESVPLFMKGWWLDAVCGESNWDACIIESNEEVIAALPFFYTRLLVFDLLKMPLLSSGWGPWIRYPADQKHASRISYEHQIIKSLISKLPKFDYFNQRFRYGAKNNMAFFWNGFKLSVRYNYILPDLTNLNAVFDDFNSNIRREIRKAAKTLIVEDSDDIRRFYQLNTQTFQRKGETVPYSFELIKKIDESCKMYTCRRIYFAFDAERNLHAGLYLVWDDKAAYYLMGAMNHQFKSGAFSLLMWTAIQHAASLKLRFDFEGSMIESVERFFREFGAKQESYVQVQKANSFVFRIADFFKML